MDVFFAYTHVRNAHVRSVRAYDETISKDAIDVSLLGSRRQDTHAPRN